MILVYSAVLSAYVYKYVALHIRRCLKCDQSLLIGLRGTVRPFYMGVACAVMDTSTRPRYVYVGSSLMDP